MVSQGAAGATHSSVLGPLSRREGRVTCPSPKARGPGPQNPAEPNMQKAGNQALGAGTPRHLVNACAFGLHHLPSDHHPTMHAPTQARNEFGLVPKDAFISKSHPGTPHPLAKAPP